MKLNVFDLFDHEIKQIENVKFHILTAFYLKFYIFKMGNTTQFSEALKIKLKLKVGVTLCVKLHLHTPANCFDWGSFNFSLFCNSLICAVVISYLQLLTNTNLFFFLSRPTQNCIQRMLWYSQSTISKILSSHWWRILLANTLDQVCFFAFSFQILRVLLEYILA